MMRTLFAGYCYLRGFFYKPCVDYVRYGIRSLEIQHLDVQMVSRCT